MLELGGNDPLIVMEDADLDKAAALAAVSGSYKNSGQRCTAVKRILVHEQVADDFVERAAGKHRSREVRRSARSRDRHGHGHRRGRLQPNSRRACNDAVAQGARLLAGNVRRGALYSPTVLDDVRPEMSWCTRRPSARSRRSSASRDIDEAIRIANGTAYGLSSAVCTNRLDYITRFVVGAACRHGQRPRGAGLSARADAVRRHQGFGPRLQGRRAGSDEELHQRQDLLAALVRKAAAEPTDAKRITRANGKAIDPFGGAALQTLLNLLAAIALLVWGTHIVRTGVLRVFGANLRQILRRSVDQPLHAPCSPASGVTGVLQSSTATALIVASFVGQGLIATSAALAVMLGADVGTSR